MTKKEAGRELLKVQLFGRLNARKGSQMILRFATIRNEPQFCIFCSLLASGLNNTAELHSALEKSVLLLLFYLKKKGIIRLGHT